MSNRQFMTTRTLHPKALAALGEEACIVALEVARDLRDGTIPPERYNQAVICGSACCIAGHMARRLGVNDLNLYFTHRDLREGLFNGEHPSDPLLAADAIERYVYDGSETPWEP
jgi:hypothetical protein